MLHAREDTSGESWGEQIADLAHGFVDSTQGSQGHVQPTDAPVAGPAMHWAI
jgi:hypothetical protein